MADRVITPSLEDIPLHRSEIRRVISAFFSRRISVIGFTIVVIVGLTAIFASLLAPYNPNEIKLSNALAAPGASHLLGTDVFGRDTLSRIIYGCRTSLMVGLMAVGLGATTGVSLGLIAGYFGGWVNGLIMRAIDALMCIPPILNALIIAVALGPGLRNLVIALSIGSIPTMTRLMCGQVLSIKQNDYILASEVMGSSDLRIMLKHIVINAFPPILVMLTIGLGVGILSEAGMSFLGVGVQSPTAAWGSMVAEGYPKLMSTPILSFAPGLAIMITIFGFNMTGDGLRDALDPKLKGVL